MATSSARQEIVYEPRSQSLVVDCLVRQPIQYMRQLRGVDDDIAENEHLTEAEHHEKMIDKHARHPNGDQRKIPVS